jgi:hypothetical protein
VVGGLPGSGRMFMRFWAIPYRAKLFVMQRSSNHFAGSVATSEGLEPSRDAPTIRIAKIFSNLLSLAEAPVVIAIDLLGLLDAAVAGRRRLRPARTQTARVADARLGRLGTGSIGL